MYTPSYRHAANFLNKNKDNVDLTLDLIDLYPSLINQDSCTKLRRFIGGAKNSYNNTDVKVDIDNFQDQDNGTTALPEILVSQVTDELLGNNNKQYDLVTPRLCVCGDVEADKWHRLLVNLCCKYSVTCVPVDKDCSLGQTDVDLFVFLLDSKSFDCDKCRQTMRQAYISNTTVLFVRDMEFELFDIQCITPTKLCNYNEASEILGLNSIVKGSDANSMSSLSPLPAKYAQRSHGLMGSGRSLYSCGSLSRFTDSGLGRSGCSSRTSFSPSKSPSLIEVEESRILFEADMNRTTMTDDERIKISRIINSEYGSALTYHYLYHDTCVQRIHSVIANKIKSTNNVNTKRTEQKPSSLSMKSKTGSPIDLSPSTSPEPKERVTVPPKTDLAKRRRSVTFLDERALLRRGSVTSDTVYVITDPMSDGSPVIVHWPKDLMKEPISNSPSIESFGFQEVDLSKSVNELDLFEDSEYE